MSDYNINKYINEFCRVERELKFDSVSDEVWRDYGRILDENRYLFKLIDRQKDIIKSISKQKDTKNIRGLTLRWIELSNSIWRKILNIPKDQTIHSDNRYYFSEIEFNLLADHFKNYISMLQYSVGNKISERAFNIYFDVTSSINKDYTTGIQRVVYELGKQLLASGAHPIFLHEEKAYFFNTNENMINEVNFEINDCLLLLDHSWDFTNSVAKVMANNKANGGLNICLLYDIIPLKYPEFVDACSYYIFKRWVETISSSDLLLSISRSVVEDVLLLSSKLNLTIGSRIEFFNLGADFEYKIEGIVEGRLSSFLNNNTRIFLSVGTLEPRKAYSVAIDAVEKAWSQGYDFIYIIVGRIGHFQTKLIDRITSHREYGSRLFWFDDLNNEELSLLYTASRSLIFPSIIEGYGLPLVEAANYDLPAIVSDIPVFHEIAGDHATYFEAANSSMLAEKIIEACNSMKIKSKLKIKTWENSFEEMMVHINKLNRH